jgi:hypothetical protein
MFCGLMSRVVSQGESRAAGLGVVLTGVNDPTLVMKKREGEKELSCDFLHHGEGNSSLRKDTTIFGHVRAHGLDDKAHVISVGPAMLKLVQKTQDMICAAV